MELVAPEGECRTVLAMNTDPQSADVRAFLSAYVPSRLPPEVWAPIREDAIELVVRAGAATLERVKKDLELLADVAAHLQRTGVAVTLEALLSEGTLAGYDTALAAAGQADRTRENKRGRFRRLRAAHQEVPGRKARRADGERVAALVQPEILAEVTRLLPADGVPGRRGAGALQTALDDARRRRRGTTEPALEAQVWAAARQYTRANNSYVTKRDLDAMATYEVLAETRPVATTAAAYGLTRRDLDLGLALAQHLSQTPSAEHAVLLRG